MTAELIAPHDAFSARRVRAPDPARREEYVFPASFAQRRLWFLHQLDPASPLYNIPAPVRVAVPLDVAALHRSLNEIVRRHESLRTTFKVVDGEPRQVVHPPSAVNLRIVDLRSRPEAQREAEAQRLTMIDARRPFSLARGPLFRATLLVLDSTDHVLLVSMHHIVSDAWSMGVLFRELAALYAAFSTGQASPLPALALQYADFTHWQDRSLRGEVLAEQLAYWRAQLAAAPPVLDLPTDRPRPAQPTHQGAGHAIALEPALYQAAQELGKREGATPFMTLLAAFYVLLHHYTGQTDLVIGTPVANRPRAELEPLIGLFVNTLVLRTQLARDLTFRELLSRVREVTLGAYAHQDMPFERLVEDLAPERDLRRNPLFQVMFNFLAAERPSQAQAAGPEAPRVATTTAKFDLTLAIAEADRGGFALFEYDTDLFDAATIARMGEHYLTLLRSVTARPDAPVHELSLLGDEERRQVVAGWNATEVRRAEHGFLHEVIAAQAARTPDAIALIAEGERMSYGELVSRANQLARFLARRGVGPDVLVGVCMERSMELVVALLAVLQAGGAYLPLDPGYPRERLAFMLEDAAPAVVLTQARLAAAQPAHRAETICIDTSWPQIARESPEDPALPVAPEQLAYVIYTSGSTGRPKGAMNSHGAIANRLAWMCETYHLDASDRVLHKTPTSFDVSITELFWPLMTGATMVIARHGGQRDTDYLVDLIAVEQVTTAHFVPSLLRALLEHRGASRCTSLRQVVASGEALTPDITARFHALLNADLHNLYGPTEAAVEVTAWTCPRTGDGGPVPIGRPIANTQIYILDDDMQPVPIGVPGELYIGGAGVGRGYLRRPDLTAARFVPDPFSAAPGRRLYRTGDRARLRADGVIDFLGRLDDQEKIRGFRIELGEIEAALRGHPSLASAVVVTREMRPGDKRLVAYVVPERGAEIDPRELSGDLRRHLAHRLPEPMVPSYFVVLAELPLLPNGKLDRRALPPLDVDGGADGARVAPRGTAEESLARIFADVLGHEQVGVTDHFFELGGHSLLATRVVARVHDALGVEIPLRQFFEAPTVEALARLVVEVPRGGAAPVVSLERGRSPGAGAFPLSYAQARLWFLDRFRRGDPAYNIPAVLRIPGSLDVAMLEHSLNEIVRRHDALRTTFDLVNGEPTQIVAPALTLRVAVRELREPPGPDRESAAQRAALQECRRPFDLTRGPLLRALVITFGEDTEHLLVLTMHHIVSDGASLGVLHNELSALYAGFLVGQPPALPELPLQYPDYALWQRQWLQGDALARHLAYWRERLRGQPPWIALPTDHPRPAIESHRGATHVIALDPATLEAMRRLCRREAATLFMGLVAAFSTLLHRFGGDTDIVIGTPVANRGRTELEGLIGFFVNTLVLRVDLAGEPTFEQLLARVREITLGAFEHQEMPFEKLVEELHPERDLSRNPMFQVMFMLQHAGPVEQPVASSAALPLVATGTSKFDLSLSVIDAGAGAQAYFEYSTDLFDAATIERLAAAFQRLLAGIGERPDQRIAHLPLHDAPERVDPSGATSGDPPATAVHAQVAAHAASAPEAIAIVSAGARICHGDLDRRADRIARALRAAGVGPGVLVGIHAPRSVEAVAALLGVLRAGGTFVPLDPSHPPVRTARVLADARPAILLVQDRGALSAADATCRVIAIGDLRDEGADAPVDTQPVDTQPVDPGALACVLYRSSPEGEPLGIQFTHGALAAASRAIAFEPADRVAHVSSLCEDAALVEVLGALAAGACVVVLPELSGLRPRQLALELREQAISVASLPPATLRRLASEFPWALRAARLLLLRESSPSEAAWIASAVDATIAARIRSVYGGTEAGGVAALRSLADTGLVGEPVAGVTLHLLGDDLASVPPGFVGEIYASGAQLAHGYLGRPASTARTFVPGRAGELLHRTGDLARRLPDGRLELRGRRDGRALCRGVRVELDEIAAAIRAQVGVRDAAVMVQPAGGTRDARLVAALVPEGSEVPPADELRTGLAGVLPGAMIPAELVTLDALPRAPSGEVSRRALLAHLVREGGAAASAHTAPRNDVEASIAGIWADVFGVEQVSVHDDFFTLGGHSLLATQVIARVGEAFGVDLPLMRFFENPSVAALAHVVAQLGPARSTEADGRVLLAATRAPRHQPLPLSFAQQRLWFLDQFEPSNAFYNIPSAVRATAAIDVDALRDSLDALVQRHESLRTTFAVVDQEPVQIIAPALSLELSIVDLRSRHREDREPEARRIASIEGRRPFDLARGPLLRAKLIQLDDADSVLLLTVHHIVADGWSMDILFRDLGALYAARLEDRPAALPDLAVQYADFAVWQRAWLSGAVLDAQLSYWREQLAGAPPVLELPTDRLRPPVQAFRGGVHAFTIPPALADALQKLCMDAGATLFMGLLAAFDVLLHRYTGQEDLVVGTPIANRVRPELEGLVGFFANTLAMRVRVSSREGFRQLLARVREVTLGAYDHQDLPFEKLVEELNPGRSLAHNPIFQVMIALQNTGRPSNAETSGPPIGTGTAKFDLILFLVETRGGIAAGFEYNSGLFDPETVAGMAGHFCRLLEAAVADPGRPVGQLPVLSPDELGALAAWNATSAPSPDRCVHELFAAQVERSPDAPAVRVGERELTYRALDQRANGWAHRLQAAGMGPGAVVGVCMERSLEMTVAVLAILKTGAAYLPLDPRYPAERLGFMLADAHAPIVLTQERLLGSLPASGARAIAIDGDDAIAVAASPATSVRPDDLAYVIFTSGSTGRPKGVAMRHRPLANLVAWQIERSALPAGARTLQFASLSFDVSFQEMFSTWCAGGTLVLLAEAQRSDPDAVWQLLCDADVQRLFLPYVALQHIAERARGLAATPASLREIVTAGEQLQVTPAIARLGARLGATLYNQYGPSETHVVTELALAPPASAWPKHPSIGRPIPSATIHVLDGYGQPVPVGVPGELHIGGAALARGFLGRPALTAERFVPDPFTAGGRLYRTGDRARYLRDGTIEFLGRLDDQVKIRGFRVEPGEVEAKLREHPAVKEAVVVSHGAPGDALRLVAYVEARGSEPTAGELRAHLAGSLPEYMVPSAFVILDRLPLTPSGKLDRRTLPEPTRALAVATTSFVAPRTPVEARLAALWADLLHVERVGVRDDFFALGGHSLLATRLVSRIRDELGADLPLRRAFEAPTIEELAVAVVEAQAAEDDEEAARILAELEALSPEEAARLLASPDDAVVAEPV